ncbi:TrmH family RNA methyltransferase [Myroides sp. LJL119]
MNNSQKLFQDLEYLEYLETFLTPNRIERFEQVLQNRTNHITIVAEDVYQMHNTSAVMRSCEVFGVQNLGVIEQKFGRTIDKEIALGAQKWVDIKRYNSAQESVELLKQQGYQIVATTPHVDACYLEDFDITKASAIYFGTEKTGLSDYIMQNADTYLKIPMVGFTESLNISVSAALVIQNLTSRIRKSDLNWKLTPQQIIEKRIDWARKTIKDIDFVTQRYLQAKEKGELITKSNCDFPRL